MCTRYPIINRVSELKVHIELTRFVQPEKSKLMQTKGQLMKSLHTAFSFAPPSILSLTICIANSLQSNGQKIRTHRSYLDSYQSGKWPIHYSFRCIIFTILNWSETVILTFVDSFKPFLGM